MKLIDDVQESYRTLLPKIHGYLLGLRDIRNIGVSVFVVLVLLISWSGVNAIQTNYELQQETAQLQQQNEVKKLQNENQKLQNQYYTTSQYREVTARQNFGLASPGETVLIVPKDVALAHTVPLPVVSSVDTPGVSKPFWQDNFQAWVDFLLHR